MEDILLTLQAIWTANPGIGLQAGQLYEGLAAGSEVPPSDEEARAAVADLVERELAESVPSKMPSEVPQKCYRITAKGRDFASHKFPWNYLDAFAPKNIS